MSPSGTGSTIDAPRQTPDEQVSPTVQESLSSHALPSGMPVPVQAPAKHASPVVQRSPSSHGAPLGTASWTHSSPTQASAVQGLLSSHAFTSAKKTHSPVDWRQKSCVHAD